MTTSTGELDAPATPIAAPAPRAEKAAKSGRAPLIMGLIAATAVLGGTAYYVTHRGLETTDDAQVDAEMVSVPSRTSGVVTKVFFAENQQVKAGDVLAELDAEPARARLAQADAALEAARASALAADADARVAETNARGNKSFAEAAVQGASSSVSATRQQILEGEALVASAKANRDRAEADLGRARKLFETGAVAEAELDRVRTTFDTAKAAEERERAHLAAMRAATSTALSGVQEAKARLEQSADVDALINQARARARTAHAQVATAQAARDVAALELSYTRIVAPQDGLVSKKTIAVGQMVGPGQGIVQLVPAQEVWITGNFKETQLAHMRAGQPAHASVDAFPGLSITGEVESFSAATGAKFSLLPPDNATGNFTKVVQRVPVRVRLKGLPAGVVLRPGMSVDLTVDTRK